VSLCSYGYFQVTVIGTNCVSGRPLEVCNTRGVGKSLAQPGRKQATATEDFYFHIYILFIITTGGILLLYIYIYIYIYNKTSIKRNVLTIKQKTTGSRSG
jgi:hypothetical protein